MAPKTPQSYKQVYQQVSLSPPIMQSKQPITPHHLVMYSSGLTYYSEKLSRQGVMDKILAIIRGIPTHDKLANEASCYPMNR